MSPTDYERYYVRHLPHVQPISATFFVTCRLAGTIPQRVRSALLEEAKREGEHLDRLEDSNERRQQAYLFHRRSFGRWDAVLDSSAQGPTWLREERVAQMVAESLHYRQDKVWDLLAYCLMPNHLHIVFTPLVDSDGHCPTATAIMQSFKGYTAHKANVLLHRQEAFWQHESYDHWVRDEDELARIITYVINNPVKAGLVEHWEDWPWTYSQYAS
ncbi:MAG: REP-associated tyrosine transposase [Anaerolineae bacterium]